MNRNEKFKMKNKDNNNPRPFVPYYGTQQQQQQQPYATATTTNPPITSQYAVPTTTAQQQQQHGIIQQPFVPAAVAVTTNPQQDYQFSPQQQQQQPFVPQPYVPHQTTTATPAYNPQYQNSYQPHNNNIITPTAPFNSVQTAAAPPTRPPPSLSNKSAWFDYYDRDYSGKLSRDEIIRGAVETLSVPYGSKKYNDISNTIHSVWVVFDTDRSGSIERHEFCGPGGFGESLQQAMMTMNNSQSTTTTQQSKKKVRVGIPSGYGPGKQVMVPSGGKTEIVTIPDRSEWIYLNTGQATFDIEIPTSSHYSAVQQQAKPPPTTMTKTVRVGIPKGSNPGSKVNVPTSDGKTNIVTIPDRSKWIYLNTGQPAFDIQVPTAQQPQAVHYSAGGGTNITTSASSYHTTSTSSSSASLPPWKNYNDMIPASYQPPPLGMKSVSVSPQSNLSFVKTSSRRRALIIGINYTGDKRAALRGCINDAKNMKNLLLRNQFPNDGSHMVVLVDDSTSSNNHRPTRSNIFKAMQWLMQGVRGGDVLFFHFSGHGAQVPDRTGHEADGLNETILPLDYKKGGQITDDEMWGSLVYPLPAGARLTALMDCCHSGTGLDLPFEYQKGKKTTNRYGMTSTSSSIRNANWIEDINPAHSQGDVVLFSGCQDDQTSADTFSTNTEAGGAMTQSFISAFESNPYSTYPEFLSAIQRSLRQRRFSQIPQLTSSQAFSAEERIFSFVDGIAPNRNPHIGRIKNKHVRPGRTSDRGRGIGPMGAVVAGLGALALGDAIFDF